MGKKLLAFVCSHKYRFIKNDNGLKKKNGCVQIKQNIKFF